MVFWLRKIGFYSNCSFFGFSNGLLAVLLLHFLLLVLVDTARVVDSTTEVSSAARG
jgi:hypothetical protein